MDETGTHERKRACDMWPINEIRDVDRTFRVHIFGETDRRIDDGFYTALAYAQRAKLCIILFMYLYMFHFHRKPLPSQEKH